MSTLSSRGLSRRSRRSVSDATSDAPDVLGTTADATTSNGHGAAVANEAEGPFGLNKRRKTLLPAERVARLIVEHNLLVNELFHLKEYTSVAYWDPAMYSSAKNQQLPRIFEEFAARPEYELSWGDDPAADRAELESLSLRFQRRLLAERETQLAQKYPFKNDAVEQSERLERQLLEIIDVNNAATPSSPRTTTRIKQLYSEQAKHPRDPQQQGLYRNEAAGLHQLKHKANQAGRQGSNNQNDHSHSNIKTESSSEENFSDSESEISLSPEPDTHYKLKDVKYLLAPPLVTHPSHIPLWRPTPTHEGMGDTKSLEEQQTIIPFKPTPVKVIVAREGTKSTDPSVQARIHQYLSTRYKSAIIDESVMPDYNSTLEEYEAIMQQQEELVRKLYRKVHIEKRMELHGDHVEPRKTILPQTNGRLYIDPFRANDVIKTAKSVQGAVPNATHQDILLAQGMAFSKLHQQARKQHYFRTRRIAQMIEQYFRKKAGEKERLEREREQNLRKISRLAIQAVKKRWTQASKVVRHLQQEEEEELKRIRGREHLSQMLEHSTQLLEAQLSKPAHEQNESDESSMDSDEDLDSTSDSDDDGDENPTKQEDEGLTVEELRLKYNNLTPSTSSSSQSVSSDDDIDADEGLAALYGGRSEVEASTSPMSPRQYNDVEKKIIEETKSDPNGSLLDESSDGSDSESDIVSGTGSDSDQEIQEKASSGLSTLFNNGDLKNEDSSDSDVEMASASDSDHDMSESTAEEDEPSTPKSHNNLIEDAKAGDEIVEDEVNGSKVRDVPIPSLLRGTLRPYQKQGLNWLASLYNNNTNGILADEMGLGKTIQTIALLAYLACEHHIWGPHLIVVPTSVMLNWEMEFKKFAPGFKVLTYYGSPQQRAAKRKGWNKPDAFHVCITSYQLVVHDHQSFKRRRWRYMILDEAHNIKNFRSTRWKALLNFNTENRLLLTGTPLQNNLMELWSLLYFLMPSSKVSQAMPAGFANLDDFQQWFGKPVDRILEQATMGGSANADLIDENTTSKMDAETRNTVARLHQVLRPYLLRRLKKDVEKQMPGKYEHIVYCRLSKRQRYLYDDFMSRAKTKETLASGNFLSIINCLMQLRKVCNHPDLFEVRPIVTSFAMPTCVSHDFGNESAFIERMISRDAIYKEKVSLLVLNLDITAVENLNYFTSASTSRLKSIKGFKNQIGQLDELLGNANQLADPAMNDYLEYYRYIKYKHQLEVRQKLEQCLYLNILRCDRKPMFGASLINEIQKIGRKLPEGFTKAYMSAVLSLDQRADAMADDIEKFSVLTPTVVALDMTDQLVPISTQQLVRLEVAQNKITNPFHKAQVKLSIAFPDKSLLQYDCGKLQKLATLMQDLIAGGHRALIFTQMTKVLDILEQFLNIHGYRYMRLDGSTKIEDRQLLTEKFNRDNKIPVFILSTRSGGLGINLTGADTVIFYDSDWNPAMDKQCQDRCHRIGQSRDVHIYRFVSEYTIESNILRKANQKRQLDNVVIQDGEFTTDYFGKFSVKDLVKGEVDPELDIPDRPIAEEVGGNVTSVLAQAEDEDDRAAASAAMKEVQVDDEDFDEDAKSVTATPAPGAKESTPGMASVGTPQPVADVADVDFEEGVGHIDEYMLRFIADGNYWD